MHSQLHGIWEREMVQQLRQHLVSFQDHSQPHRTVNIVVSNEYSTCTGTRKKNENNTNSNNNIYNKNKITDRSLQPSDWTS